MKKNYIIPKLKVVDLGAEINCCLSTSETETEVQWSREERHLDSEEGTTGRRNIWDNEW